MKNQLLTIVNNAKTLDELIYVEEKLLTSKKLNRRLKETRLMIQELQARINERALKEFVPF